MRYRCKVTGSYEHYSRSVMLQICVLGLRQQRHTLGVVFQKERKVAGVGNSRGRLRLDDSIIFLLSLIFCRTHLE